VDHTESIVELKQALSENFIKKIIPLINKKAKTYLGTRGDFGRDVRNVKGYHLGLRTPTDMFYWNFIKSEVERLYFFYKAKFPLMMSTKINQIDLLRYKKGGKYEVHTDHFTSSVRHLSVIMNLNEEYEGGELIFTDQKENEIKRCKLGKGSVIFFPSNFMYPHKIAPIKKGTRYSIVAWLQ
tara:strand:- start:110 stop:655 length:546 start_codon:yes stop_codon:yes gene_type:complete